MKALRAKFRNMWCSIFHWQHHVLYWSRRNGNMIEERITCDKCGEWIDRVRYIDTTDL